MTALPGGSDDAPMDLRPLHVERTGDPHVLRWVCHDDRLTGGGIDANANHSAAEETSKLSELIANGVLTSVVAEAGDLLIAAPSWDRELIETVTGAVRAELAAEIGWLGRPELSVVTAQRIIDDAIGPIADAHGGAVTVVGVFAVPGNEAVDVVVELAGACDGCPAADETLYGHAQSALHAVDPTARLRTISPGVSVSF